MTPANALVDDDLNGAMEQIGISTTDAVLDMVNNGDAEIAAHANAAPVAGAAVPDGHAADRDVGDARTRAAGRPKFFSGMRAGFDVTPVSCSRRVRSSGC